MTAVCIIKKQTGAVIAAFELVIFVVFVVLSSVVAMIILLRASMKHYRQHIETSDYWGIPPTTICTGRIIPRNFAKSKKRGRRGVARRWILLQPRNQPLSSQNAKKAKRHSGNDNRVHRRRWIKTRDNAWQTIQPPSKISVNNNNNNNDAFVSPTGQLTYLNDKSKPKTRKMPPPMPRGVRQILQRPVLQFERHPKLVPSRRGDSETASLASTMTQETLMF
jgi:hypothetical protein